MAQLDDMAGDVMNLKDNGLDQNTMVVFTTDNGAEVYTWPDGGTTPFAGAKGEVTEGSFRVPAVVRWPGHVPAGKVANGIMSGLDWFPTLVAAAGDPNIKEELQTRLLPQHRHHLAWTGGAGSQGSGSEPLVQIVWCIHRRSCRARCIGG